MVATLFSCDKPEKNLEPSTSISVSNITSFTADVHVSGYVSNSDHEYNWGVVYGTQTPPRIDGYHKNFEVSGNSIESDLLVNNLYPNQTYYMQAYCERNGYYYYDNKQVIPFDTPATFNIGDIGPGGGIVFYLDVTGGGMEMYDTVFTGSWECLNDIPGTYESLGTGSENTVLLLAGCPSTTSAAGVCSYWQAGGYDDWYLPSMGDLNEIYENLSVTGIKTFPAGEYISSSQAYWSQDSYRGLGIPGGQSWLLNKTQVKSFVAIRSF